VSVVNFYTMTIPRSLLQDLVRRITISSYWRSASAALVSKFARAETCRDNGQAWLDRHILQQVYTCHGICLWHHRGTEPSRHPEPPCFLGAVRQRDRAPTSDAAALGLQAPQGAPRGRLCGGASGRAAARLPDQT